MKGNMTNSERMLRCLEKQDLDGISHYFQLALEKDDEAVLLELANYLEGIGFLQEAEQVYQKFLPHHPELAIQLAQIAFEDGLTEEAFAYLDQIDLDSPFYVEALVTKADLYQAEGLADVAREKLLEASHLSDEPLILLGLAELDMELKEFQEAITYYAQLDNREIYEMTGISTYQRIGLSYANLGKFEVAIEFLEKAAELEYDDQTIFELAALLFEQEDYQKANIYFKQLQTISPDFDGYPYLFAQSLHAEHRIEEALAMVKIGLARNEFDENLLLLASQYAYELHDEQEAETYLLKAKDLADDMNEVILRLSSLYLEQERYAEVVHLASADLDNVLARWNTAKAYLALEQDKKALAVFESLFKDLSSNPEFLLDYIDALRQMRDFETAKQHAKSYLALVPDDLAVQEFISQN